jgi:hypothetical protein
MQTIVYPLHYMVVERIGTAWHFSVSDKIFYNPRNCPVPSTLEDRLHRFGFTIPKVVIELFWVNGGKAGYYLADLRGKKYYYCGGGWNDVRETLLDLGIGRREVER